MSHVKLLSCLNDSWVLALVLNLYLFMVHFWDPSQHIFRQQASWWLPCFTPFLLSTLTQSHSLPTCHSSHTHDPPVEYMAVVPYSTLSSCLPWPNFWGFCMAFQEYHAFLSGSLEYDKSFNILCLSEGNFCGYVGMILQRLIPPITIQREKPNSEILHLSAPPPLLPIYVNDATIYLFTKTKN